MTEFQERLIRFKIISTGIVAWLAFAVSAHPAVENTEWVKLLLAMAPMVWLPLAFQVLSFETMPAIRFSPSWPKLELLSIFPVSLLFGASLFMVEKGWQAGLLASLWLVITILVFWNGLKIFQNKRWRKPEYLAIGAACAFLPIGGFSALADRIDFQPLGFDATIILLTAAHFHYAGFLFLLLIGLAMKRFPSLPLKIACYLAVFAVPVTAVGIAISHLWQSFLLEAIAAAMVAIAGWCCAAGYFKIIFSEKVKTAIRLLWSVTALSLIFSMTLALLFALRTWLPLDWLTIPQMWALHGTVNVLGVSGCGVLGWLFQR